MKITLDNGEFVVLSDNGKLMMEKVRHVVVR
jgi:hypothetical protein